MNYKFMVKLALTFRLSLNSLCRIMGQETSHENQMRMYENIKDACGDNYYLKTAIDFLFFYENARLSKNNDRTYSLASFYLVKLKRAIASGNQEEINKVYMELNKIDNNFYEAQQRSRKSELTEEDYQNISKYRAKYAISRDTICNELGIEYGKLRRREDNTEDKKLKERLDILSEFHLDMSRSKAKGM